MDEPKKLPPGPAFIPGDVRWGKDAGFEEADELAKRLYKHFAVPEGYIWKPATEGTMAGWVRPPGGKLP